MISARNMVARLIERYKAAGGGRRLLAVECNFSPTCSEFTRQAVLDRGVYRGLRLGWARIRRCNQRDLTAKINDPYLQGPHGSV